MWSLKGFTFSKQQGMFVFHVKRGVPSEITLESPQSKILVEKVNFKGAWQDGAGMTPPHFLIFCSFDGQPLPHLFWGPGKGFSSSASMSLVSLWTVLYFLRPPPLLQAFDPSGQHCREVMYLGGAQVCWKPRPPNVLLGLYVNSVHETISVWELLGWLSVVSCYRACAWGLSRALPRLEKTGWEHVAL